MPIPGISNTMVSRGDRLELEFVATTSGINVGSLTVPATAQAGDLAVYYDVSYNNDWVTPTGWTNAMSGGAGTIRMTASFKILTSGDIGASVAGQTVGNFCTKRMVVFRPNMDISAIDYLPIATSDGTDPLSISTVISAPTECVLLLAAIAHHNSEPANPANLQCSPVAFDNTYTTPFQTDPSLIDFAYLLDNDRTTMTYTITANFQSICHMRVQRLLVS